MTVPSSWSTERRFVQLSSSKDGSFISGTTTTPFINKTTVPSSTERRFLQWCSDGSGAARESFITSTKRGFLHQRNDSSFINESTVPSSSTERRFLYQQNDSSIIINGTTVPSSSVEWRFDRSFKILKNPSTVDPHCWRSRLIISLFAFYWNKILLQTQIPLIVRFLFSQKNI